MNRTFRKTALCLSFGALILAAPVYGTAGMAFAAPAVDPAQQTPSEKFVQTLGDQAIHTIADKSLSEDQRMTKYRAILREGFDLKTIGHFVIGRAYDSATPDQQQEYMKLFEQLVLKIYGSRLNFYSGESFHVTGEHQESDKDTMVNSEIDHPGGANPTPVDWRVRQADGKYAVIDVVIEGISQSITQRQEYASVIQRDGGKIDGLLTLMRQRVQEPETNATQKP